MKSCGKEKYTNMFLDLFEPHSYSELLLSFFDSFWKVVSYFQRMVGGIIQENAITLMKDW